MQLNERTLNNLIAIEKKLTELVSNSRIDSFYLTTTSRVVSGQGEVYECPVSEEYFSLSLYKKQATGTRDIARRLFSCPHDDFQLFVLVIGIMTCLEQSPEQFWNPSQFRLKP
jgi:hypothetical protein